MKIVCDRRPLLDAVALAARLAERRSTVPILTHVKLATGKGRVTVTGTNMDRVGAADVTAAIGKAGTTTINAELLLAFVKNAPDGCQVEIEDGGQGTAILRAGRAVFEPTTIPRQALDDIRTLAATIDGAVRIEISPHRVRVSGGGRRLSTKLVDGEYPDYKRIIPEAGTMRFSAGRVALEAAIGRCSGMADNKDRSLRVDALPKTVSVSARSSVAGEIVDEIDAATQGKGGRFFIHATRIAQALSALACPDVDVEWSEESPIVFRDPRTSDRLQLVGGQKG